MNNVLLIGSLILALRILYSYLFPTMSADHQLQAKDVTEISRTGKFADRAMKIIDVRGPAEYAAGHVNHALNVPVDQLEKALQMKPADFENEYKFALPPPDSKDGIVVYCQRGGRAARAAAMLKNANYTDNLYIYSPGWSEYSTVGAAQDKAKV
ncbi:hypothetical protein GGF46_001707 [Coemansia sp. RSA 552]|nr:hypothetical protein GGF46_001707 [Coemansia sp. RSA 552]